MEKPFIVEALLKQTNFVEKEVEGSFNVGISVVSEEAAA